MARKYQLKERAQRQEETRQRIVEATVALHTSVGPARTTIKGIAELAGVERLTVYRHFPEMESLFTACRAHSLETNPPPDPAAFRDGDPEKRLRTALVAQYGFYNRNEQGIAAILRDASLIPGGGSGFFRQWDAMTEALLPGWRAGWGRHARLRVAIHHAVEFETWRSLVRTGHLPERLAIDLMVAFVRAASGEN